MTKLPPTTPSEMALAEREIASAGKKIDAAAVSIAGASYSFSKYAQGTAVTRLMEVANLADQAAKSARNAARLLF